MSLTMRPALRWAAVSCSRVTPQRFIQYSTACRSDRSSRSLSMKPRLSFKPAMGALPSWSRGDPPWVCSAAYPTRQPGGKVDQPVGVGVKVVAAVSRVGTASRHRAIPSASGALAGGAAAPGDPSDKALTSAGSTPTVLAACDQYQGPDEVEPSSVVLACGDGNASLTDLHWSSWTATGAVGSGEFTHNLCEPDCADGTFVSEPTQVRLSYPIESGAGLQLSAVSYTYHGRVVPTLLEVTPVG